MEITAQSIAKDLLAIHAVFLRPEEPFTWASGIKSPIYCDNRLVLSYPEVRGRVEQGLANIVKKEYPECTLVAGTSTAGIAHAALVADILGLPMCYVRGTAKDHGRNNQIEGRAEAGQKVVVIEDLISTGGSVLDVVEILRAAGCEVLGIASIFTYGLEAGLKKLAAGQVRNVSLSNYDVLIEEAVNENYVRQQDLPRLRAFRQNPQDKSWVTL
ncbi:MAG: orotate phosphoribosyltransferase [Oscillospiraceae bacterium]